MSIRLVDLTLGYDRHPAVHHLSGEFAPGSLTAVVGPNGAGKSTLLKAIKGLLPVLSGRLELDGLRPRDIAYLPQQAELDPEFPIAVTDVVLLGHWRRSGRFGVISRAARAQAAEALAAVGLAGLEHRAVGALSVGQRQRMLFARVLLEDAPVILLDEPFAAVDARTTADLFDMVRCWNQEGRTLIAVLHDLDQVRRHFPRTLLLARDCIAWGPTADALTLDNLIRAQSMGEPWVEKAPICRRTA